MRTGQQMIQRNYFKAKDIAAELESMNQAWDDLVQAVKEQVLHCYFLYLDGDVFRSILARKFLAIFASYLRLLTIFLLWTFELNILGLFMLLSYLYLFLGVFDDLFP